MRGSGFRRLFRLPWRSRERIRDDVDDEIAFHLEMRTEELVREHDLAPEQARERAEREFGDVRVARRALREKDVRLERHARWRRGIEGLAADGRYTFRALRKRPGFAAAAVAVLGLGIGAAVAMFTVVNTVVLRPLPYHAAERLVEILPAEQTFNISLATEIDQATPSIAASTGLSSWQLTLTGTGEAAVVGAQVVDAGFFETFAVQPELGRGFLPEERDPARSAVVILSHDTWRTRFGADPEIVGRRLELDGYDHETREVVGVMPRGFRPPYEPEGMGVDVWVPLHRTPGATVATDSSWYVSHLVGRLAPGATVEGAAQEVRAAMAAARAEYGNIIAEDAVRTSGAIGLLDSMVGDVRNTLWLLLAAVGLVVLLACVNLANLLLARAEGERAELAVRAALGASRGRLVRAQLTRGAVLALAGGAIGVGIAYGLLTVLRVAEASGLPRAADLSPDGRVLAFAFGVSLLSALAFALLPALRATAGDLRAHLAGGGRGANGTRATRRLTRALVAGEVAFAVVLVASAGLMLNSFRALRSVDPGIDADDVLAVQLSPRPTEFESRERTLAFYDQVIERLRGLPGVRQVGGIHILPFTDFNWAFPYLAEGRQPPSDGPLPSANFRVATPGYFAAVDIPILDGRDFAPTDGADAPRVALVNRSFVREAWQGGDAVGREIRIFGDEPVRVVGVVGDVRQHALDREPRPEMYMPLAQWRITSMVVMVEGDDPAAVAPAVRDVVSGVDANVPIAALEPLSQSLAASVDRQRFFTGVLGFFGLLALVLGAVGVYGVTAYVVRSRLREFGVRLALGASPAAVRWHAFVDGLLPVAIGLIAGLGAAVIASRALAGLLYDIRPTDPSTYAIVTIVLTAVAVAAIYLPVLRAGRVEPAAVLDAR